MSAFTAFEHLDGLFRQGKVSEAAEFRSRVLPTLEVVYPDEEIFFRASQVHAALVATGQTIGVTDIFIAATAMEKGIPLVNANTRHFNRVVNAGFTLSLRNWREA